LLSKDNTMSFKFCLPDLRATCIALMATSVMGLSNPALAEDDDTARTVVARSDEVRFPRDGFQVLITIESTTPVSLRKKESTGFSPRE
jgi:hypothetical protein